MFIAALGPMLSILFDVEWKYWAIAGFVIAVGLCWVFVARKFRQEYGDPTAKLNVFAEHVSEARNQTTPISVQMPETPRKWKPLISMHRPREVYLPTGAKVSVLLSGLFAASAIVLFAWGLGKSSRAFLETHGLASRMGTVTQLACLHPGQSLHVLAGGGFKKAASRRRIHYRLLERRRV